MIVSGALPVSRTAGPPGWPRPCCPYMYAAVTVHVMAPRRAAAGLAAQMVQLMAAGACACSPGDCIRNWGLDGSRPGSTHGRRERLGVGTADAAAFGQRGILIAAPTGA